MIQCTCCKSLLKNSRIIIYYLLRQSKLDKHRIAIAHTIRLKERWSNVVISSLLLVNPLVHGFSSPVSTRFEKQLFWGKFFYFIFLFETGTDFKIPKKFWNIFEVQKVPKNPTTSTNGLNKFFQICQYLEISIQYISTKMDWFSNQRAADAGGEHECLFPGISKFGNTCLTRRIQDMLKLWAMPM